MYTFFLAVHSVVRWVALILGVVAFVSATLGWLGRRHWKESDRKLGVFYTSTMDLQFLVGLILFIFLSPYTHDLFRSFSAGLSNPSDRFFGLIHPLIMIVAIIFAHVGSVASRKVSESSAKYRSLVIWFGLSVLLMLVVIPWSRPLLRAF